MKKAYALLLICGLAFTAARTEIPTGGKAGPPGLAAIEKAVVVDIPVVSTIDLQNQEVELQVAPVDHADVQHAVLKYDVINTPASEKDISLYEPDDGDIGRSYLCNTDLNVDPGSFTYKYEVQRE